MKLIIIASIIFGFFSIPIFSFAQTVRAIEFPVGGPNSFRNDFGDPRGGGTRKHQGNDIIAKKMTPLVSAVDGRVLYIVSPQASWGYEVTLIDAEGYRYSYFHVNNDTPGTDDGRGGEVNAYAPGIVSGAEVRRGQLVGWVGDSGNSENVVPHLHFEIHDPSGVTINPYDSLIVASGPYRSSNDSSGVTPDMRAALELIVDGHPDDVFRATLERGATGDLVRQLQIALKVVGVLEGDSVTGYFGPKTESAVKAFQKRQGLDQVGVVGPKTRAVLNKGLRSGVLVEYKPFYNDAELKAIEDAKRRDREYIEEQRRKAIMGIQ